MRTHTREYAGDPFQHSPSFTTSLADIRSDNDRQEVYARFLLNNTVVP
jgi:hypothetical protein